MILNIMHTNWTIQYTTLVSQFKPGLNWFSSSERPRDHGPRNIPWGGLPSSTGSTGIVRGATREFLRGCHTKVGLL